MKAMGIPCKVSWNPWEMPWNPAGKRRVCYWTWPIEFVNWPNLRMLISHSYVNVDQWVTHVKIKHDRNPMKMHKSMDRLQGNYLRAAAPAADPGRSGNESNQMGTHILRCFALSGLPPFILWIYLWNICDRFEWHIVYQIVCYTGAWHEIKHRGIHYAQVFDAIGIVGVQKGYGKIRWLDMLGRRSFPRQCELKQS